MVTGSRTPQRSTRDAADEPGSGLVRHARVVVAVSGGAESEGLIERGLLTAARMPGAELMAVHVAGDARRGDLEGGAELLTRWRPMVEAGGGTWHTVLGEDVADALVGFARSVQATHVVIGTARGRHLGEFLRPGIPTRLLDAADDLDVLQVPHDAVRPHTTRRQRLAPLGPARRAAGWALALLGPIALTAGFLQAGTGTDTITLDFLSHLTVVVFVAILGGWWPAVTAALASTMLLNWFFTPPTGQWIIHEPLNVVALGLFLLVAAGVARVVDIEARRTTEAGRARHQAATLFELAGGVIREGLSVPALLERLRRTYDLQAVALTAHVPTPADPQAWTVLAGSGEPVPEPATCDNTVVVDDHHLLLINGFPQEASDQGVLEAFAGRIAAVLQQQELTEARLAAQELAAGNAMRTALLAAVSHDLRTPLAGIKAAVSSLRLEDVVLSAEDTAELLATIEESADQLTERIEDLLDMSRIQAGSLLVHRTALDLEDLAAAAAHSLGATIGGPRMHIDIPAGCPPVAGDHGLLVRVIANLAENALKHSRNSPVLIQAVPGSDSVDLHVIDHGPGVPDEDKETIFRPFQRLGDRDTTTGVGLGLAVARGLAEGMGGRVHATDTPGGGLTMVLTLPTPTVNTLSDPSHGAITDGSDDEVSA
ncbi:ATP-binding protein [uncultured Kocuria sp.]|uniref:ATP-binding protein n=1 Tax=uncultured Kocuria sp. TaxID=259305 RepID=UPI00262F51D0|nr:ATP-binding protein [uncultured Kocuria sp.]